MNYNLWALIRWSEETGDWRADLPAFDYFAQGTTPSEAVDAAREVAELFVSDRAVASRPATKWEPSPLSPEWQTIIGGVLLRGDPLMPHQIDAAMSRNDSLVVCFRVVGRAVLWPHVIVIESLIDRMFTGPSKREDDPEEMLRNLLAVIHRDGGHYSQAHGLVQSVADAMALVAERRV